MTRHLQLVKHHGFGNDFLVAFHLDLPESRLVELARTVCERRRGVGADGLIVGDSDPEVQARMMLYNADGSRAEISGNGIRCFSHALAVRAGWTAPVSVRIRTDAGVRTVALERTSDPATLDATVAMGTVSTTNPPDGWHALRTDPNRPVAHLSVGNPHTVVAVEDLAAVDLAALGAQLPDVNLEIVTAGPDGHSVTMRVHERGAGITEACGTGACAAAVAARQWGLATPLAGKLVVHMDGGSASVGFDHDDGTPSVSLSGPTTYIATIEYAIPAT
jgi:diaminopimelate epimerase